MDVTSRVNAQCARGSLDPAKELAERIRDEVRLATGCESERFGLPWTDSLWSMLTLGLLVSIGIASNTLLARLATRKAKPANSFHLTQELVPEFLQTLVSLIVWPSVRPVVDVLLFGGRFMFRTSVISGGLAEKPKTR